MSTGCIYSIDITTNNKDIISVSSDNFDHFYIANLDENGDEISYENYENSDSLYANFFMIKIINDKTSDLLSIIERLSKRRDITKINLRFTNGNKQEFELAKKRILNNRILENIYQEVFFSNDDLCILVTDKKIKYKDGLFI